MEWVLPIVVGDSKYLAGDRELFRRLLESAGFLVVESSSGREALIAVEKTRFDLMTLDLSMPDLDGFDVLRAVRYEQPELKIVVVSGFLHGKMLEPAKSLGADATLDKDITTELLLRVVCKLLKNPKSVVIRHHEGATEFKTRGDTVISPNLTL